MPHDPTHILTNGTPSQLPVSKYPDNPVIITGIGPGNPDFLTSCGKQSIEQAGVVLGYESVISYISSLADGEFLRCTYENEPELLRELRERQDADEACTVVMMGDPLVSGIQFLQKVERSVHSPALVLPGISSIQIAASRARIPLEETTFVTFHKRGSVDAELDRIAHDAGDRHLLIIPRPSDWNPPAIAAHLVGQGTPGSLPATVYEHLTLENETATVTSLTELADMQGSPNDSSSVFSDLSILLVENEPTS